MKKTDVSQDYPSLDKEGEIMYREISRYLVEWIRSKVDEAHAKGCVVGISGGVDSAVVAALCAKACPGNVLGIHMPCYSSQQDTDDARLIAKSLNIDYKEIILNDTYDHLLRILEGARQAEEMGELGGTAVFTPYSQKLASSNIKPRLRMVVLYYFANLYDYIVVGTGNRSELEIGYFTKYGDGGVDILPLGGLVKTQVWELAKYLGIPENIINKPPSAGLWLGQTDEGELGFTYRQLDEAILSGTGEARIVEEVKRRKAANNHKLKAPCIPEMDMLKLEDKS